MTVCLLCRAPIKRFVAYCLPCIKHAVYEIHNALIEGRSTRPRVPPTGQTVSCVLCHLHASQHPSPDPGAAEVDPNPPGKDRKVTGEGTRILKGLRASREERGSWGL